MAGRAGAAAADDSSLAKTVSPHAIHRKRTKRDVNRALEAAGVAADDCVGHRRAQRRRREARGEAVDVSERREAISVDDADVVERVAGGAEGGDERRECGAGVGVGADGDRLALDAVCMRRPLGISVWHVL